MNKYCLFVKNHRPKWLLYFWKWLLDGFHKMLLRAGYAKVIRLTAEKQIPPDDMLLLHDPNYKARLSAELIRGIALMVIPHTLISTHNVLDKRCCILRVQLWIKE